MVNSVARAHPARRILCITALPYFAELCATDAPPHTAARVSAFRETLREVGRDAGHANVQLLEGPDLLTNPAGLTTDLLHPGDLGMIEVGRNLAAALTTS